MSDLSEVRVMSNRLTEVERQLGLFKAIADSSFDWLIYQNYSGQYLYTSPSCFDICGYKPSDFYNDAFLFSNILHPLDKEKFEKRNKKEEPQNFDCRIVAKNGSIKWINYKSKPIANGAETAIWASISDITNQKSQTQNQTDFPNQSNQVIDNNHASGTTLHKQDNLAITRENYLHAMVEIQDILLHNDEFYTDKITRILGTLTGCDRVYISITSIKNTELPWEPIFASWTTGEYENSENLVVKHLNQNDTLKAWNDDLLAGDEVYGATSEFSGQQRQLLEQANIQSILLIPISDINLIGFIGFEHCSAPVQWDASEISFLQVIASDISIYEEHKFIRKKFKHREQWYGALFENLLTGIGIYQVQKNESGAGVGSLSLKKFNSAFVKETGLITEKHTDSILDKILVNNANLKVEVYQKVYLEKQQIKTIIYDDILQRYFDIAVFPLMNDSIAISFNDISENRKTEIALQQNEQRYRTLFENSPISIWEEDFSDVKLLLDKLRKSGVIDLENYISQNPWFVSNSIQQVKIIDVNRASLQLHKVADKAHLREILNGYITEASYKAFTNQLLAIWNSALHVRDETSVRDKDGEIKETVMSWSVVPGYEFDYSRILISFVDITDLKRVSRALHESQRTYKSLYKMFRLIADNTHDMLWAKDLEKNYIFVNKAICDTLLKAEDIEEPIGKNDLYFAHRQRALYPDNNQWHTFGEICLDSDDVILKTKKPARFDEYGNIENKFIYLDVYKAPIWDENDQMIGVVGSARIVTKEKEMEQALKMSEERFALAMQATNDGLFDWNFAKQSFYFSPRNYSIIEYEQNEIELNHNVWITFIHPDDKKYVYEHIQQVFNQQGSLLELEYRIITRTNNTKWLVMRAVILEYSNNKPLRMVGTNADISERKRAEQLLRQSEQQLRELNDVKNRFFSIIAHDLRNPFNALIGFSELLLENIAHYDEEKRVRIIDLMLKSANQGFNLLENLLQWARLQTDRMQFTPTLFNLKPLVDETIELLNTSAATKEIALKNRVPDNTFVFADKNMLLTTLRNLIGNAIKFTFKGGWVKIRVKDLENKISISIKDNGVGMSEDQIKMLFKLDKHYTTQGTANEEGTGLGLILCKEFVEKNGGTILLSSQPDKGADFTFTLPKSN